MANSYPITVLFKKEKEGSKVIDLVDDFGAALIEYKMNLSGGTKDVYANDWKETDGEEAAVPDVLPLKAYDMTFTIGIKGREGIMEKWKRITDYFTGYDGNGVLFSFVGPDNIGRRHCYYKDYKADDSHIEVDGQLFHTFQLTFRVTDPRTILQAVLNEDNEYEFKEI